MNVHRVKGSDVSTGQMLKDALIRARCQKIDKWVQRNHWCLFMWTETLHFPKNYPFAIHSKFWQYLDTFTTPLPLLTVFGVGTEAYYEATVSTSYLLGISLLADGGQLSFLNSLWLGKQGLHKDCVNCTHSTLHFSLFLGGRTCQKQNF